MNTKPLVLVLFVAALAVVAWLAFGNGGGDAVPEVPRTAAQHGAPGNAEAALVQGGVAQAGDAQPNVERTPAPVAQADLARAGSGRPVTVRGRLVDASKAPRAGVKVELATWHNPEGIEVVFGRRDRDERDAKNPTTTTRADGTFDFQLAVDLAGRLDLPGDELVFAGDEPSVFGRKGDQDLGDIVAVVCARLAGVVQDERGKPVAGVKVSASLGGLGFAGMSSSTTDAAGHFEVGMLRPGKWTLRTASGQFLPAIEDFTLQAEERRTDIVLVVRPGQAIAGQVLDDRGLPVAGCKVGSKRKEAHGGIDIERFTANEATTTDANGFFTLSGLAGETTTVRAFGRGHTAVVAADVPVGTGNLVLRVERLATIEGQLTGVDGAPIAGSQVRAMAVGQGPSFGGVDDLEGLPIPGDRGGATTAADGTFRLENVRPGTVAVVAESKAHRPARQTGVQVMPAQAVKGVRLVADLGAVARVTVVDEAGKPVADAAVRVMPPGASATEGAPGRVVRARRVAVDDENGDVRLSGSDEPLGAAVTDAQGVAVVTGLPMGDCELRADHKDFAAALPARATLPKTGTVEVGLTLRKPGHAEVHVIGADGTANAGAAFSITGPHGANEPARSVRGTTDERGVARVGPLVAGEYTAVLQRRVDPTRIGGSVFTFNGDEGDGIAATERRFTVKAGETTVVDVRCPVLTKLFGTVHGMDGPVAGCEIELEKDGEGMPGLPGMGGRSVSSAADGTFAIDGVEAGRYVLRYGKPGQVVKAKAAVDVLPDQLELRQDLTLRTGKVRVQAWSQVLGEPIAGAEVTIGEATAESGQPAPRERRVMMVMTLSADDEGGAESASMSLGGQRAKTGADGWAEIDDVPAGSYDVRVTHGKHVPADRKAQVVVERQTTDVGRIELGQAGRIRGKVLTADGKQAQMALVHHHPAVGEAASPAEPQPAMGGNFRLEALAPGRHLLKAQAMEFDGNGPGAFGPEVEVEVKAGETATAELRLPAK